MDVLADRLRRSGVRGDVFALTTVRPPWGVRMLDDTPLSVHAVVHGEAWLTVGTDTLRLAQGDVALIRTGTAYDLADAPHRVCRPLAEVMGSSGWQSTEARVHTVGAGHGPASVLVCGAYRFDGDLLDSLVAALPSVTVVAGPRRTAALDAAVTLLADEIATGAPGQRAVLDRILDLLLVFVLRAWPDTAQGAPGWYRALADPRLEQALALVHEHYGRRWTVASLAAAAGLSRSVFARRFGETVGVTPIGYLTEWRMAVAAEMLRTTDLTLAHIADKVGYDNEFAFSTAFRRERGLAPGAYRRSATAGGPGPSRDQPALPRASRS